MIFKDSFKVLLSNFSLVWKSGLYKLIITAVIVLLSIGFLRPIAYDLVDAEFFVALSKLASEGIFGAGLESASERLYGVIKIFVEQVFTVKNTLNFSKKIKKVFFIYIGR